MGDLPGHARSAYSGTIDIGTGCTSDLPRGNLSTCRSDTPILGSGHMRLYPLYTVPTVLDTLLHMKEPVERGLT